MNWDDMRIFLSVVREESLSGAARALRLDPATVGRRIARLEHDLGAVLFVKSPQGYVATDAGERLLTHASAAETALAGAETEARGAKEELTGTIRLGSTDGCASYLLPHVTRRIQAANPGLDLQVVVLPRFFNLSKREADMAIGVSRPSAGRLTLQKVSDYRLHLAASKDYLARHGPVESPEDLKSHPVVGYIPDMIFDSELDYLSEFGLGPADFASNLVAVQLGWLRAGAGVGVVHDFVLPDAPDLVPLFADTLNITRTFWLIRHADDARVPRLNRFARALTDELRAEIARRTRA
ncbi:MAG: LysR family transcriptional regulator [Silicimonas sp.]|nr:LysR family transcriptional regulator [Silicimonas sp.]NND21792.1 LysR family transcriptional regulator [Silicimonas sp.]NND41127.1 LysR family transcriptional regulator [Silicimonas sp.]